MVVVFHNIFYINFPYTEASAASVCVAIAMTPNMPRYFTMEYSNTMADMVARLGEEQVIEMYGRDVYEERKGNAEYMLGEFILTNTNRLVRFYDGCNGLKTGSTDKAGFCISVTAKRGDMQLIAVVMNADTITERNNQARALLDFGFSSYALYKYEPRVLESCPVMFGKVDSVELRSMPFCAVVKRSELNKIELIFELPEKITAPVSEGQRGGGISFKLDGESIGCADVVAVSTVERISFFGIFLRILKNIFV